jgi:hypothetical protein
MELKPDCYVRFIINGKVSYLPAGIDEDGNLFLI